MVAVDPLSQVRSHTVTDRSARLPYSIRISEETDDPSWDAFLAETPGGHHVQTSLWAQVKASMGWLATRVVVSDRQGIVAGGQILFLRVPGVGRCGYVSKGPVLAVDDPTLAELVITRLREVAAEHRCRVLFVQPPNNGQRLAPALRSCGFGDSPIEGAPTATVLVDLTADLDDIVGRMRKGKRNGVRRTERNGMSVRQGTETDLATFHRLLVATSERREFTPFAEEYIREMWRALSPRGHARVFIAEYEDEAIAAQLVVPFGDTVIAKLAGWSGRYGQRRPNEALDWATIKWAKAHGYRHYDLDGIDPRAVETIARGGDLPESIRHSPTYYKIGFGGEVRLLPETHCYIFSPLLRSLYKSGLHRISGWSRTGDALDFVRMRRLGSFRSRFQGRMMSDRAMV